MNKVNKQLLDILGDVKVLQYKMKQKDNRIKKLETALNEIIHEADDLSGNPAKWSSHIAMKVMGWTFKNGNEVPPEQSKHACKFEYINDIATCTCGKTEPYIGAPEQSE